MNTKNVLTVIVLFVLTGCAKTPIPIPPTITTTPSPTPTPTPTPTQTPTPTPTTTPTATPTPTPTPETVFDNLDEWAVEIKPPIYPTNCDDDDPINGYRIAWASDFCVPGMITRSAQWYTPPNDHWGLMSSYAEGVMERMCRANGPCDAYRGGVAVPSCALVGQTAWLRVPGRDWGGPFLIVDCSQRNHAYWHHTVLGLAAEIGYTVTRDWGMVISDRVDVHIGKGKPNGWSGVYLPSWWVRYALEWETYN